jgi:hypothetical protein
MLVGGRWADSQKRDAEMAQVCLAHRRLVRQWGRRVINTRIDTPRDRIHRSELLGQWGSVRLETGRDTPGMTPMQFGALSIKRQSETYCCHQIVSYLPFAVRVLLLNGRLT